MHRVSLALAPALALALALLPGQTPAQAPPDADRAVQIVLDLATAWPADLTALTDLVAAGGPAGWRDLDTSAYDLSHVPAGSIAADPWRAALALDHPGTGQRLACARFGRTTLEAMQAARPANPPGPGARPDGFSPAEINSLPFWDRAPPDAVAFLTCDALLRIAPGADPGASALLAARFAQVATWPVEADGAYGVPLAGLHADVWRDPTADRQILWLTGFHGAGPAGGAFWNLGFGAVTRGASPGP